MRIHDLLPAFRRFVDRTELAAEDLSPVLQGGRADEGGAIALIPGASLFEIEREAILRTLEQVGGSTARAAESSRRRPPSQ